MVGRTRRLIVTLALMDKLPYKTQATGGPPIVATQTMSQVYRYYELSSIHTNSMIDRIQLGLDFRLKVGGFQSCYVRVLFIYFLF